MSSAEMPRPLAWVAHRADRLPPRLYFVLSAIFHYRAVVFARWRRPWRAFRGADRETWWAVVSLGAVFAVMNYSFYVAIDRLPLGTVAAIEFVGSILLALAGSRSHRNLAALGLAVGGVYLLTDLRISGEPAGFVWAFANAGLVTLYIVLAHRNARAAPVTGPIDRLGAAMLVACLFISPLGLLDALPALVDPVALGAGVGVGIASSVIPYVVDQLAITRLPRATYANLHGPAPRHR